VTPAAPVNGRDPLGAVAVLAGATAAGALGCVTVVPRTATVVVVDWPVVVVVDWPVVVVVDWPVVVVVDGTVVVVVGAGG
jgi:hypothetical protein